MGKQPLSAADMSIWRLCTRTHTFLDGVRLRLPFTRVVAGVAEAHETVVANRQERDAKRDAPVTIWIAGDHIVTVFVSTPQTDSGLGWCPYRVTTVGGKGSSHRR